jgi:hypothetical protein
MITATPTRQIDAPMSRSGRVENRRRPCPRHGDEIWWDTSVPDDDIARAILDEYYNLPDTVNDGVPALFERFTDVGMDVVITDGDTTRPATRDELGLDQPKKRAVVRSAHLWRRGRAQQERARLCRWRTSREGSRRW